MATPFILLWTIFNLSFRSTLANEKLENSERSIEKGFGVLNIVRLGISPAWLIDLEESYKAVFQNQFGQVIPKYEYKGNAAINLTNVLKHYGETFNTREFFSKENSKKFNSSMLKLESKFQYLISTVRITYNCKSSHYLKDQENITESTKLIDTIQGMIKNPMVRLISGDNVTEYFEDYHTSKTTNSPKGCYNTK
ncbi:unnamed protein product, partial [Allacma fusca]